MPLVYKNQKVITVSQSSKAEIIKLAKDNFKQIEIINPGINISTPSKLTKTANPQVLYLGRLQPYKNIDVAIRAFANVTKTFKNALLYIVGEGENFGNLYDLVLKLGLEKKVKFYGKVSEEEKIKLLSQSWVAVQPSTVEGWGITVLEANACKTPVVASDTKGLRDSVKHGKTGSLVKVKDVKGFSKEIKYYLRNEKVRKSSSKKDWANFTHPAVPRSAVGRRY
jgi:glycosyltransferase involved in cell wall biosynthesis